MGSAALEPLSSFWGPRNFRYGTGQAHGSRRGGEHTAQSVPRYDEGDRELYGGEGFVVTVTANLYRLELTEVAATTVMGLTSKTTCEAIIIVGGGGYGLKRPC